MQKVQDLLWLWAILGFTILPAVRQFIVSVRRQILIARIEKARGTKVVMMVHRQGSGILGALFMRYIDLDDSERMMREIRNAGDRPIDLLMHTPGGLVIAAEQIARVLNAHKPGVTAVVPQYAMSGGTLLAMAADEIIMDENAMLGPIDPQLNNMPAAAYLRVMREKEPNTIADETIMMADMAAKATAQVRAMAQSLLAPKLGAERAGEVATMLTEGRWTHDYPLHIEQLQELGLPVSSRIPAEFLSLLQLSSPAQPKAMRKAADTK